MVVPGELSERVTRSVHSMNATIIYVKRLEYTNDYETRWVHCCRVLPGYCFANVNAIIFYVTRLEYTNDFETLWVHCNDGFLVSSGNCRLAERSHPCPQPRSYSLNWLKIFACTVQYGG